ncbi:hypothetical protein D3C72_1571040 [compost metagenome]
MSLTDFDLTTPFLTWTAHYYQRDTNHQTYFGKWEIQEVLGVEFLGNPNLKSETELQSSWFNGTKRTTEKETDFSLQTHYNEPLNLKIVWNDTIQGFQFGKIKFSLFEKPSQLIAQNDLKYFKYKIEGNCLEISKKSGVLSST